MSTATARSCLGGARGGSPPPSSRPLAPRPRQAPVTCAAAWRTLRRGHRASAPPLWVAGRWRHQRRGRGGTRSASRRWSKSTTRRSATHRCGATRAPMECAVGSARLDGFTAGRKKRGEGGQGGRGARSDGGQGKERWHVSGQRTRRVARGWEMSRRSLAWVRGVTGDE